MPNLTITQENNAGVMIGDNYPFEDSLLTFAAEDTFVEGTILAKSKVAAGAVAPKGGGNTGDGTCTEFALASGKVAKVGSYKALCTVAGITHGGTFEVTDPNGALIGTFVMPNTAGGVYVFEGDGITFKLTDAGTNFAIGDLFTLAVTAIAGKYVPYLPTGTGGAEFPVSVLTYECYKSAIGDLAFRVMLKGDVRKEKLVIDSGAAVGAFEIEELRKNNIYAISVNELNIADNQ